MALKFRTVPDWLIPIVYRFTIRSILITGFALIIILAILTALLTEWTDDQAMGALNKLITVDHEISDLCLKSNTLMSNARRHEKDFILSYKDFGFSEAKSRYISRVLSNLAAIKGNTKKIRLLTDEPEVVRQTLEVDQAVGQYQEKLLVMVEKYGRVGSYDSGLVREFRDTAHEMENLLKGRGNDLLAADLLSMRRREKDFIERSRDYDVAEFRKASVRFKADVARSGLPPELKEKLEKLADTYQTRFEEYVKSVEEIRAVKRSYLMSVQVIEPTLEKLYLHAGLEVNNSLIKTKKNDSLFSTIKASASLLALLVSIIVAIFVSVIISSTVNESKAFAEQIASGNLRNRLAAKGKNEFATLSHAMNDMADSLQHVDLARQKWAAELYASEEKIRRLNQELELKVAERTRQLVETQEELVQKEKLAMLGLIAGNMGNELRNPLGVMNNAVYFLQTVMPDADETVREYLEIIGKEIDNAQRIISDLLDYSQNKPLQPKEVLIHEMIQQSRERCAIPECIGFQADLPETLPKVMGDPLQMGQIFKNLITNAVQAMPKGGTVRVSARFIGAGLAPAQSGYPLGVPLQDFIEISVTDTGEGIAPENMEKLFQPLFTTRSRGIGLGLAISQKLTEANGGRIEVESELGKGTTFIVMLPVEGGEG